LPILLEEHKQKLSVAEWTILEELIRNMEDFIPALRVRISRLDELTGDDLSIALRQLENEVTNMSNLSAYNLRQFDELLKPIRERAKKSKNKTFSFRRKEGNVEIEVVASKDVEISSEILVKESNTDQSSVENSGSPSIIEVRDKSEIGKDCEFCDLNNCTIVITVVLGALTLSKITDSRIFVAGSVRSSLVVRDALRCEIHCRSKQVRIHNSNESTFYLTSDTPPIIENSSGLKFGPYTLETARGVIEGVHEGAESSNPSAATNYEKVRDFNWLKSRQSPNWATVAKRQCDETLISLGLEC
jgi:hypothetical protein